MAMTYNMTTLPKQTFHLNTGDKVDIDDFIGPGEVFIAKVVDGYGMRVSAEVAGRSYDGEFEKVIIVGDRDENDTSPLDDFQYMDNLPALGALDIFEGVVVLNASSANVSVHVSFERTADEGDVTIFAQLVHSPVMRALTPEPLSHDVMDINMNAYMLAITTMLPYLGKVNRLATIANYGVGDLRVQMDFLRSRVDELENRLNALEGNTGGGQEGDGSQDGGDPNGDQGGV